MLSVHAGRDAADESDQVTGTGEDETGNDNGTGEDDFSEGGDLGELLQRANGELGAAVPAAARRAGEIQPSSAINNQINKSIDQNVHNRPYEPYNRGNNLLFVIIILLHNEHKLPVPNLTSLA
jgi:hypothetical protein